MTTSKLSRRAGLRALAAFAGTSALAGMTAPSQAAQFHMDAALVTLNLALRDLKLAVEDKGGHRIRAIEFINNAIAEVKLGIQAGEATTKP